MTHPRQGSGFNYNGALCIKQMRYREEQDNLIAITTPRPEEQEKGENDGTQKTNTK